MKVSSYIIPDDGEEEDNQCNVWVQTENGDEYDVSVELSEEGYNVTSISRVIADIPIARRSSGEVNIMKEMAIKAMRSIYHINSEYE